MSRRVSCRGCRVRHLVFFRLYRRLSRLPSHPVVDRSHTRQEDGPPGDWGAADGPQPPDHHLAVMYLLYEVMEPSPEPLRFALELGTAQREAGGGLVGRL